jgi:hypothetical protein
MKKFFLLGLCIIAFSNIKTQISFCSSGAEWRYNFTYFRWDGLVLSSDNEKIKYERDTILGNDTCKVLSHSRFYSNCNVVLSPVLSFLKQKGDTIYYRNYYTQNNWQILYNFAAQTGQSWKNNFLTSAFIVVSNTLTVNQTSTVSINGFTLKRQFVSIQTKYPNEAIYTYTYVFTERLGSDQYLFYNSNFSGYCGNPDDNFDGFLCYKDNSFGLKKFTSRDCNFSNPLGINYFENNSENITLYPNPFTNKLTIRLQSPEASSQYQICIRSVLGNVLLHESAISNVSQDVQLDLSEYSAGIYFVQLFENKKLIETQKVIKE